MFKIKLIIQKSIAYKQKLFLSPNKHIIKKLFNFLIKFV